MSPAIVFAEASNANVDTRERHISGIDGLRALAVISVVIYHLRSELLPGGFTGVDVFFVISGFVISKSLANFPCQLHLGAFLIEFYRRRLVRIMPALVLMLIVTGLAGILFIPNAWLSSSNRGTAMWSFLGMSNLYLVAETDGYFTQRVHFNPFTHTWSLAVEEQFYLIFPFIFFLWLRTQRHTRFALSTLIMPLLIAFSLWHASIQTIEHPAQAFYLLPSRFWELGCGALLFKIQCSACVRGLLTQWSSLLQTVGFVLVGAGMVFARETSFPFPWALLPVLGTMMMIGGIVGASRLSSANPLQWPVALELGRISYSLYLWHWPIFTLMRWTIGLSTPMQMAIALFGSVLAAELSYRIAEVPLRRVGMARTRRSMTIIVAALCSTAALAGVMATFYVAAAKVGLGLSVTRDAFNWRSNHPSPPVDIPVTTVSSRPPRVLLVVGDSHAGAYDWMARQAAHDLGAAAIILTRGGCSVAKLIDINSDNANCADSDEKLLNKIERVTRPGDIVFLASLRVHRLSDQWAEFSLEEIDARQQASRDPVLQAKAVAEAAELISRLEKFGLHVLLDAPKPIFRSPPFRCSDWFNRMNPICSSGFEMDREFLLTHRRPAMEAIELLQQSTSVAVWDPFPILCPGPSTCSAFDQGRPVFMDGDHLSGYGNRLLIDSFRSKLRELWGGEG